MFKINLIPKPLFIFLFLLCMLQARAHHFLPITYHPTTEISVQELENILKEEFRETTELRPNPILTLFKKKRAQHKKSIAAVLAFPFPFGLVGLHRIYLGCAPYIPVVYIASLGGVFGILPLVDFFVILAEKDLEKFTNSTEVFMWVQ